MTTQAEPRAPGRSPTDEELAERFRPVFDRIAEHAVERESQRRLPHEEIGWLRAAGFGAVRVPVELGGSGATLTQLVALLIDLGAAESNLPQALRAQFGFVEGLLADPGTERSQRWLAAAGRGVLVGNATSERGANVRGIASTTLSERDGRLLLNGTKYYTTGSLFADHLSVAAQDARTGRRVGVLVPADAPGVERRDDFTGIGQRLTASGTTVFTDVEVDPAELGAAGTLAGYRAGFAQLVLLAALAGIARRAADDVADYVRRRTRTWGHGNADLVRADPLVQQVVGRVDSAAHAARATVLAAAAALERSGPHDRDPTGEIDVYRAQVTVPDLVLRATSELFEVGGASSVDEDRGLDRHWRNARTIAVHNPVIYKQRIVGEYLLDGTAPEFTPSVGIAPALVEGQR
ncbi:acyl-CoA dehydrogenase family protein [Pseudonocardia aurantiaca]|uniref:Acyl-CoA dehydrogenase family protein n=1 Tax=Pseudonocardia aurantiaca TaxID=75290 RepID=A0ABW4FTN5_9PSEU